MKTSITENNTEIHRKTVDVTIETHRILSHQAIELGLPLKIYLQNIIEDYAKHSEDMFLLKALHEPGAQEVISDVEQQVFESYLNQYR